MSQEKNQKLEALYDLLTEEMTNKLKTGSATASDLSVIRQFLKDNNITSLPTKDNALGNLVMELPKIDGLNLVEDFNLN